MSRDANAPGELPPTIRIGTSGFVYRHWRAGVFYPEGLPAKQEFPYYSEHFDTVELNHTFYRLPTEGAVRGWAKLAPPNFVFAVKGSRYLTHVKRLKDAGAGVERFFGALAALAPRIGPVLWQLPPNMKRDVPRLSAFARALPDGFAHVVEFRNEEWYVDEVFEALNDLGLSLCLHDKLQGKTPFPPPGPLYYRRFHGADAHYGGRYGRRALHRPASEMVALSGAGRTCFAYFNNDLGGAAIRDAFELKQLVAEALVPGITRDLSPTHGR
jgi:uncharacterized protein YecE (DUF72 family)